MGRLCPRWSAVKWKTDPTAFSPDQEAATVARPIHAWQGSHHVAELLDDIQAGYVSQRTDADIRARSRVGCAR